MTAGRAQAIAQAARDRMAAGALREADALLARGLREVPGDPGLLYLRGVIANRERRSQEAAGHLEAALGADPRMALAWLGLGQARARSGEMDRAMQAFARAAELEPTWADARFNLGVVARRVGDLPRAAAAFHAAWRIDPALADAARGCVATLAAWARADPSAGLPPPRVLPPSPPTISVVVCSIDDAKAVRVEALYRRLLAGLRHEVIVLRDARSLAEAYNRGLDACRGDLVVLSHDDVDILAADFAARLVGHLERHDGLGVVGGTRLAGPLPIWAGHPHVKGWITHHGPGDPDYCVDLLAPEPVSGGIVALDGVFLAGRREVFAKVRFDATTFDGFHGYDVDWSVRAAAAGFRLAAAGDLLLVHASRGRFDATWQRYAGRFCAKHGVRPVEAAPTPYYETRLAGLQELRAFYGRLLALAEEGGAGA